MARMNRNFLVCATVLILGFGLPQAAARWKAEYASQPQAVQDWYRQAQLTSAAQARFGFLLCCDNSDVVKTHFEVDHSTGRDVWTYEDVPGHMKRIPDDIIHWGQSAPGGLPTLFVWKGQETCFFPGEGGI